MVSTHDVERVKLSEVIHTIFSSMTAPTRSHSRWVVRKGSFCCDGWVLQSSKCIHLAKASKEVFVCASIYLEFCRVYCCMCWKDSKTGPEIQSAAKIPGALQLPLGPGGCLSFISAALTYLPNRKTKTWLWAVQLQGCQELFGQRQG